MNALLLGAMLMTAQDTTWAPLARVLDTYVARRAFPGAVVAVGRHDTVLYLHAFGHLDYEHGQAVTTHTVYDLASLTKVVGLTSAMMMQVRDRKVDLDAPAVRYVPAFHDSAITVRELLTHSSGLPAWKPFFQRVHSREEMFALVNAEPREHVPGGMMVYSDLGAMVLTQIAERVAGARLDSLLERTLFAPLGMTETRYLPPPEWLSRIAPTEMDTTYRHRLVHGEVHDENAFSMGGVSGHAGLFSTAPDLVKFAQLMLRPHGIVDSATVAMFTAVQRPGFSSRALGWDTPSDGSSAGTRLLPGAFGHTGFTGTSIWIDPAQDLFVILLTNRVYPTRENHQILDARRAVADTAVAIATGRR